MFIKIGTGIFNSEDIRAVIFNDDDEIIVHLKPVGENQEEPYTVEKDQSNGVAIDRVAADLNKQVVVTAS